VGTFSEQDWGDPDERHHGSQVGDWPAALLATPGHELVGRAAALGDTDTRAPQPAFVEPPWVATHDPDTFRFFRSEPTLEPTLVTGNEALVAAAFTQMGVTVPSPCTPEEVDKYFQTAAGKRRKGEFALEFAAALVDAADPQVPVRIREVLDYLYDGSAASSGTATSVPAAYGPT